MESYAEQGIRWTNGQEAGHGVTGNCQGKAAGNHTVNADDAAMRIGQWTAGISRREPNVGLQPGLRTEPADGSNAMDYAGGQRADEAEGIADGDRNFARTH